MLTVFDPPSIDLGGPILSSRRPVVKPGLAATAFGGTGLTTRRLLELLATVGSTEGRLVAQILSAKMGHL